jgi:L-cystine transport system ATP-binding protein
LGDVSVNLPTAARKDIRAVRRSTAMVFQSYNLFNNKTVLQNLTEGLVVRKVAKKEAEDRALSTLEKVGLVDKRNEYPCYLSGDQQQRVGIARAVVLEPQLILFDEPTSALDPELVGDVLKCIRGVAELGITMVIVTHEMSFAFDVATRVVFLDKGVVVEQGSARDVLLSPREERTQQFLSRFSFDSQYTI